MSQVRNDVAKEFFHEFVTESMEFTYKFSVETISPAEKVDTLFTFPWQNLRGDRAIIDFGQSLPMKNPRNSSIPKCNSNSGQILFLLNCNHWHQKKSVQCFILTKVLFYKFPPAFSLKDDIIQKIFELKSGKFP